MALGATLLVVACTAAYAFAAPPKLNAEDLANLRDLFEDTEKQLPARSVEEVQGYNCPYFEVIEGKSLYGFNTKTTYDVTQLECMEACAAEYNFYCRSADYNSGSSTCYLSSESDETQPQDFDVNFNTIYFRRLCERPTTSEPASGSGWYYG